MTDENSTDDLDDSMVYDEFSLVQAKCDEYIELYREDNAPTFAEFAARTPQLQSQILELLPTIVMMESARNRSRTKRKDGRVMRGPEQIPNLGDYKIIREIGRGGMGIVYEAHQISLNRLVAIKLLPKHMLSDEQVLNFQLEASTAAKLHHTNIAPIYGVGQSSGFHFYAMQLLEGVSLDQFVGADESLATSGEQARDQPSIDEVIGVGRQVASALQYAHDQGVLHRDIKPSNLIQDANGNVWMTDFGLAISKDSAEIRNIDEDNSRSASGTLRYMAPEKLEEMTNEVTGDIYSLGITLIELLSGRPAFASQRIGQLIDDIKAGNLSPLTCRGESIPGDLEAVLRKSIAVDRTKRYKSAGDFEFDLQNVLETRPVTAKRRTLTGSVYRWAKRNRALAAASVFAFAMLIATTVISTTSYVRVEDALDAERHERVRAVNASRVASNAMEEMFGQFSSGSSLFDWPSNSNQTQPRLTNESAALATQLSDFYAQLASQRIDDEELPMKAIGARSRVGELNERLGNYVAAAAAFRSAITGYENLLATNKLRNSADTTIQIARLYNQLGMIKNTTDDLAGAAAEHQKAIDLLTAGIKNSIQRDLHLELELARSYYFQARRTRPGMGPNSLPPVTFSLNSGNPSNAPPIDEFALTQPQLDSLEIAIRLLRVLASEETSSESKHENVADAGKYLLALCYRELATDDWSQRTDADRSYQKQAIELLESLVAKFETETLFQFDLMSTLAEINVFAADLDEASVNEAYDAVGRAITYGGELASAQPDVASYQIELIHCLFKLGRLAELKSRFVPSGAEIEARIQLLTEQEISYRRAMMRQTALARTYPNSPAYRVWTARFVLSLATCETMKSQIEDRDRLAARATTILNRLPPELLVQPEVMAIIEESIRLNQQTLAGPEIKNVVN